MSTVPTRTRLIHWALAAGLLLWCALTIALRPVSAAPGLDIANVATQISTGEWTWTAYVSGPREEIDRIGCVTYTLHPTFPNPVQKVCWTSDEKYPFGLTATGWGAFALLSRIEFKDGSYQDVVHVLDFSIAPF